ncbi:MAG: AzlD domain-containing protein [Ectothiorhodospiraceae bacterium]|nr:AzlD domain-containing protein [Ectothiorhodospiraceae bacterium]MCH8504645.1 AzlD domain-containing protein [Ectothiorhodospiraceae bacterium]
MSQQAMIWLVILVGGGASYLFRILPQLIWQQTGPAAANARLLRLFDYAAYAVIGGIVASSLIGNGDASPLERLQEPRVQAGMLAVGVTFMVALLSRRQILSVLAGLAAYQLVLLLL